MIKEHGDFYKVVFVTQKKGEGYSELIEKAIQSQVTSIQLREKNMTKKEIILFGREILDLIKKYKANTKLIVNDSVSIALALNADGVHLGQGDCNVLHARKKLGNQKIIGLTVNSFQEVIDANFLPIDYIGIGPIFKTRNKKDVHKIWRCSDLKKACCLSKHKIIAIGGINTNNINQLKGIHLHGIAAIQAFHEEDIEFVVRSFKDVLKFSEI